jgi:hypothetical protein
MAEKSAEIASLRDTLRERLDEVLSQRLSGVDVGKAFLKWGLGRVFEATEEEADDAVVDGAHDAGVDAIWPLDPDEQRREFYIIQAKAGSSHHAGEMREFVRKIEAVAQVAPTQIQRTEIADAVGKFKRAERRHLLYLTDQSVAEDDREEQVHVFQDMEVRVRAIDLWALAEIVWERTRDPGAEQSAQIYAEKMIAYGNYYIAVVPLGELGRFVDATEPFIFESNIRQFLKWRTRVNREIRKTLQYHPEKFFYYNNGITIVTRKVTVTEPAVLFLDRPQIVNGAQTSNAVLDAWRRNRDLSGSILVTIIQETPREMENITRNRNSQNAVRGKDLVALSGFHKTLASALQEQGYFYEIQNGKFDSLRRSERAHYTGREEFNAYLKGKKAPYCISSKDAIQAFVAGICQQPTEAYGHPSNYLPNGSRYDQVFTDELEPNYRLFLFPWLVKEFGKGTYNYGRGGTVLTRSATFFYVFVYFWIAAKVLRVDRERLTSINNYSGKLDRLFRNFDLNERICSLANRTVEKFLEDSQVEAKIKDVGDNYFFKSGADRQDMLEILSQKVRRIQHDIEAHSKAVGV